MDLLSSLPDEVLCHVLSFLTTKEAASTSILAKRWRDLLAFVPNLAIDDSFFLHPEEGKRGREDIIQSFMVFVDRVFELQGNSPLKKVSIKLLGKVDSDRVDTWIRKVLERGVSDLNLEIFMDSDEDSDGDSDEEDNYRYRLSPKCFECSTLIKLKIYYIGWLAGSIFLPMLKTLILDAVQISSVQFGILLHALPALEEVVLTDILWQGSDVIMSSVSLKSLTINSDDDVSTLSLDTPSLVYFEYFGFIAPDYPVVNMENLIEARIMLKSTDEEVKRVRGPNNIWLNDELFLGYRNVWKLFHGIQNVPSLYLSPSTLEMLSLCFETMPVFNNLKSLELKSNKDRGWQAMPVLLRNCPNLETLFIEGLLHHVTDKCGDACPCISRDEIGRSLKSSPVNRLEIQGFRGTMKEMKIIKHFLDYFPCLERLDVFVEENDPTQLRNPEVSDLIEEMFDIYNELSSCKVELLISDFLNEKWTAQGHR